jgi:hypothetical protein
MDLAAVEAMELWETRRGFSKLCGKAAEGRLSEGRQIHNLGSWSGSMIDASAP